MPRLIALLLLLGVSGCGALAPFPSAAPALPPGTGGMPVGICYSRLASSAEELRAAAAQECVKGSTPRLVDTEWNLNQCPLLSPTRAIFVCSTR